MKIRKILALVIVSCTLLFANSVQVYALDLNENNSVTIEKSDSTEIEKSSEGDSKLPERKNEDQQSKSVSKVYYNIIYYLIAKFILINPFTRPS